MRIFVVRLDRRRMTAIVAALLLLAAAIYFAATHRAGHAVPVTAPITVPASAVFQDESSVVWPDDLFAFPDESAFIPTWENIGMLRTMADKKRYLYNVDATAFVTEADLALPALLAKDLSTDFSSEVPKILIFHTHSQEAFRDSRPGKIEDTIVGIGRLLAEILTREYGIAVVHDIGQYDVRDGVEDRSESYAAMEPAVRKILEKYPSIEIAIDLHRDGVPDDIVLRTELYGVPTAKIMFFNGITRLNVNGTAQELPDLVNPYLRENLATSLQMHLTANTMYPSFTRRIYIKAYRYSLHLLPKSVLVEVGANTNTVEEARNAMPPLARIIAETFKKH